MSYEFKKLSEVEALTEMPEGAKVLAESNGQIVRVPGSGLGGGTNVILKSSTADSTKRFKITVDDSGTLSATEVTE